MSELAIQRRRSRAEVLYCLDVLIRHISDENVMAAWLSLGIPDGTLEKWPTDEQVDPFLGFAENEREFDDLVSTALRTIRYNTLKTTLTYMHESLA